MINDKSLNEVLSLMHRMDVIDEAKEYTNVMDDTYQIEDVDGLLKLFTKYAPKGGWKISIGYITALDDVFGSKINSGRDLPFSDDEKAKLKSYGDESLSDYADNPVFYRKKYKNPYRPSSDMNMLMKYNRFTAYWTKNSEANYTSENQRQRREVLDYILNNKDAMEQYLNEHPSLRDEYDEFISHPENENVPISTFIADKFLSPRGINTKSEYVRVPGTPFKQNKVNGQYMYSTFLKKDAVQYYADKEMFFIVDPDTENVREITKEQAIGVSEMFVSKAKAKTEEAMSEFERMIKTLKNKSDFSWKELNLNQVAMMKFSFEDENGEIKNFHYKNKNVVTRLSKNAKTKEERYTTPGRFGEIEKIFTE